VKERDRQRDRQRQTETTAARVQGRRYWSQSNVSANDGFPAGSVRIDEEFLFVCLFVCLFFEEFIRIDD